MDDFTELRRVIVAEYENVCIVTKAKARACQAPPRLFLATSPYFHAAVNLWMLVPHEKLPDILAAQEERRRVEATLG
jgi:hypothetical protein